MHFEGRFLFLVATCSPVDNNSGRNECLGGLKVYLVLVPGSGSVRLFVFFSGVLHPSIRRDPLMNKPVLAVRIKEV